MSYRLGRNHYYAKAVYLGIVISLKTDALFISKEQF